MSREMALKEGLAKFWGKPPFENSEDKGNLIFLHQLAQTTGLSATVLHEIASRGEVHVDELSSGRWYEEQYATEGSHYNKTYAHGIPAEAMDLNVLHATIAAAWLGETKGALLDLGSGVGHYVSALEEVGFDVTGVEISKSAVKLSGRDNIICTPATDLSMFDDKQFAFSFSSAFFEHIAREQTPQVVREMMRVSYVSAHWIPLNAGADPGHIHIQPAAEWVSEFKEILGPDFIVKVVPNHYEESTPLFLIAQHEDAPSYWKNLP